jgi:cytochrome c oxidase cbb3-type subunit 3
LKRITIASGMAAAAVSVAFPAALIAQAPPPGVLRAAPRPPAGPQPDPGMVQRGDATYQAVCAACHGAQGRGGPGGSPDLTQSAIAMAADGGKELHAFLQVGRPEKGMPPFPLSEAESIDLSAKLRSLGFAAAPPTASGAGPQGARPATPAESVLVGDAAAGKAFFNGSVGRCNTCHAVAEEQASPARNLWNISAKYPDPRALQNNMILMGRSFYWSPALGKDVTAEITYQDGRQVSGYLTSVSDFKVIIRDEAGKETILPRKDGEPKVVLRDRLQHHLDLLPKYRDSDIHDLTAYLVTLK